MSTSSSFSAAIRFLAVLSAFCLTLTIDALADAPQGQSQWRGGYSYETAPDEDPIPFMWILSISGNQVSGRGIEPNSFGDDDTDTLTAYLNGTVRDDTIEIMKTYDGSGGQRHAVTYRGLIAPNGRSIVGTWSLPGGQGTFAVELVK